MKSLTKSIILLLVVLSLNGFSQTVNEKFQTGVKKGLQMLSTAESADDFLKLSNYFERIAQAETKEWLPSYYAAYGNLIAGLTINDKALQDQYFDRALAQIGQADTRNAENSEIYALKGYIQFMKMSIDPQARLALMGAAGSSLGKAKALNPDNPRIYLITGQNTFYTPEAFGGGKAKAKPILENAVAKFAIFKPVSDIAPAWGSGRAKVLLAQCN
jgi:hypothetical protein